MTNTTTSSKSVRGRVPRGSRPSAHAAGARVSRGRGGRGAAGASGKGKGRGRVSKALQGVQGKLSALNVSGFVTRFRVPLIVIAAIVALVAFLYPPARGLYVAWRENGTLQATLDTESEATEQYQGEIDSLLTEQGIRDEARRKGYVGEGEKSIVIDGDPVDDDESTQDAEPELPWYLSVGDFIFQYHEE